MNLFTTITSERGKPVTKSGNEYIDITVLNDKREQILILQITPNRILYRVRDDKGIEIPLS